MGKLMIALVSFTLFQPCLGCWYTVHVWLCSMHWCWMCRRRRAKQRQERVMKQFASKQKQFMEKVVGATGMYQYSDRKQHQFCQIKPDCTAIIYFQIAKTNSWCFSFLSCTRIWKFCDALLQWCVDKSLALMILGDRCLGLKDLVLWPWQSSYCTAYFKASLTIMYWDTRIF